MTDIAPAAPPQHFDYAPAGYHTVTPFIAVTGGQAALEFYVRAFGAQVISRMDGPDGTMPHGEIIIGDSVVQLGEAIPEIGLAAPSATRTGSFVLYVADVATTYAAALAAGATSASGVEDVFSGDRMAAVICPFGHRWVLLTRIEHLGNDEIERRAREWLAAGASHAPADE